MSMGSLHFITLVSLGMHHWYDCFFVLVLICCWWIKLVVTRRSILPLDGIMSNAFTNSFPSSTLMWHNFPLRSKVLIWHRWREVFFLPPPSLLLLPTILFLLLLILPIIIMKIMGIKIMGIKIMG